jgi:hypothetical protein
MIEIEKSINQIRAPGGHIIQLTIMIDTQQTCPTCTLSYYPFEAIT